MGYEHGPAATKPQDALLAGMTHSRRAHLRRYSEQQPPSYPSTTGGRLPQAGHDAQQSGGQGPEPGALHSSPAGEKDSPNLSQKALRSREGQQQLQQMGGWGPAQAHGTCRGPVWTPRGPAGRAPLGRSDRGQADGPGTGPPQTLVDSLSSGGQGVPRRSTMPPGCHQKPVQWEGRVPTTRSQPQLPARTARGMYHSSATWGAPWPAGRRSRPSGPWPRTPRPARASGRRVAVSEEGEEHAEPTHETPQEGPATAPGLDPVLTRPDRASSRTAGL